MVRHYEEIGERSRVFRRHDNARKPALLPHRIRKIVTAIVYAARKRNHIRKKSMISKFPFPLDPLDRQLLECLLDGLCTCPESESAWTEFIPMSAVDAAKRKRLDGRTSVVLACPLPELAMVPD
jgi:hypothetical protein